MAIKNITADERAKILYMHKGGVSPYDISIKVARHMTTVCRVIRDAKKMPKCKCGEESAVKFKGKWTCGDCLNPWVEPVIEDHVSIRSSMPDSAESVKIDDVHAFGKLLTEKMREKGIPEFDGNPNNWLFGQLTNAKERQIQNMAPFKKSNF